ncbi:MAG: hypothetical protein CVU84_00165 [Firmicutes bacterium HGW-Firmicutes-1]|jgi:competence protein ComGC|nr:MAG: hypothetical protein CVU84_00165 [Firmicutes bacterium HGW-Firmicutes-1]
MYKMIRSNQGFTVAEMFLAVLIAGIITSAISTFIMIHIKTYEETKNIIDLQYEGQTALNQMAKTAMESAGVHNMNGVTDLSLITTEQAVDGVDEFIAFKQITGYDITEQPTYIYHIFTMKSNDQIRYSTSVNSDLSSAIDRGIFAINIISMRFTPGKNNATSNESFETARSIEIEFSFINDGSDLNVKTQAKFRNK